MQGPAGRSQAGLQPWEGCGERWLSQSSCLQLQVGRRKGVRDPGRLQPVQADKMPLGAGGLTKGDCVRQGRAAC